MRFWKCVAVLGVVGLFYVGYSLGAAGGANRQAMPWDSVAHGLVVDPAYSPWGTKPVAVTASADGQTLYFWDRSNDGACAVRVTTGNMGMGPGFDGNAVNDRGPKPGAAQPGAGRRQIPMVTTPQKRTPNTEPLR